MAKGVIRSAGQGWWHVEDIETSRIYFVHHSQLLTPIYLHIGDTVEFSIVPNPVRHDQQMAGSVKLIDRVMKSKSTVVSK